MPKAIESACLRLICEMSHNANKYEFELSLSPDEISVRNNEVTVCVATMALFIGFRILSELLTLSNCSAHG